MTSPPTSIERDSYAGRVTTSYDEVLDQTGRRRPVYDELALQLGWDLLEPPEPVARRLADLRLGDDTRISSLPLILTDTELHGDVRAGVAQRASALQQFFADTVLGEATFLRGETELDTSLLDEILVSEGTSLDELRSKWNGQDSDAVRFVYGPDLVREPGGRWVVLEDNVGCVSGCADSFLVLDAYTRAAGLCPDLKHRSDLVVAVERWLESLDLAPTHDGVIALLSDGDYARWDGAVRFDEDLRRAKLVEELGVRVVDNEEFEQLVSRHGSTDRKLEAIVNIGAPSRATWQIWLGLFFGPSRVPLLNAPGTSVLGNKALLPFVGAMVSFYLGEEPILAAPPTTLLREGVLPANVDEWVVKTAAGCHGTGVFILASATKERLDEIRGMVARSWPAKAAVAQRRVEVSRLLGHLVEIRALAYALGWQTIFGGEQCIARLTPDGPAGGRQIAAPVLSVSGNATNPRGGRT